jgi:O-antigen ligase
LYFNASVDRGADGKRLSNYVILIMFVTGAIIVLELLLSYARLGSVSAIFDSVQNKDINLGWGGANNYSILLALSIPSAMYYTLQKRKTAWILVGLVVLEFGLIVMSGSRGALIFIGGMLPFLVGYTLAKTKNTWQVILALGIIIDLAVLVVFYFGDEVSAAISTILGKELNSSGRFDLYKDAIQNFLNHPLFGNGFDHRLGQFNQPSGGPDGITPYWYHSTIFQTFASLGLFGVVAIGNLFVARYRTFFTKPNI